MASFALKLVIFFRQSETSNFRKNSKLTTFSFNIRHWLFSNIFQRLTVSKKFDQFGHKRCQKNHIDVSYNFLYKFFFKNILLQMKGRLSEIPSVSTIPRKYMNLTIFFSKHFYRWWYLTSLRFFWHILRPNGSITSGPMSIWTFGRFQNGWHFHSIQIQSK